MALKAGFCGVRHHNKQQVKDSFFEEFSHMSLEDRVHGPTCNKIDIRCDLVRVWDKTS